MRPPEASPTRPAIARPSRGPAGPLGMGENGPSPRCSRRHALSRRPRPPGLQPAPLLDLGSDPPDRSRLQPFRRHPPDPALAARLPRHRHLLQGRVQPSHRQPQAPAGALAVPVRAGQRLAARGQHGGGSLQRFDRGVGGLLRAPAGAAVRGRDPGLDLAREDRRDRVPRRPLPPGARPARDRRRIGAGGFFTAASWTSSPTPARPDWRANIAESIFRQMGTSRTRSGWVVPAAPARRQRAIGRYASYRGFPTRVLCADRTSFHAHYSAMEGRAASRPPRRPRASRHRARPPSRASSPARRRDGEGARRAGVARCATSTPGAAWATRPAPTVGGCGWRGVRARASGSIVTSCAAADATAQLLRPDWYAAEGIDIEQADRVIAKAADGTVPSRPQPVSRHPPRAW